MIHDWKGASTSSRWGHEGFSSRCWDCSCSTGRSERGRAAGGSSRRRSGVCVKCRGSSAPPSASAGLIAGAADDTARLLSEAGCTYGCLWRGTALYRSRLCSPLRGVGACPDNKIGFCEGRGENAPTPASSSTGAKRYGAPGCVAGGSTGLAARAGVLEVRTTVAAAISPV